MNIKYKLGEVAKDLNKPNKEVIELLSKYTGEPRKSVSVLSEDELNYVFEYYTQKNQLQNINDYFSTATPESYVEGYGENYVKTNVLQDMLMHQLVDNATVAAE